ncbi:hypothetical protein D3C73_935880 [compost metagenome]
MACRRTDAVHVRRLARRVGRQRTAAFRHDAEPAENEDFHFAADILADPGDVGDRQGARQHDALGVESVDEEIDRIGIGGGCLNRDMQTLLRVFFRHMRHQAEIGEDQRIGAERHGVCRTLVPDLFCACAHECVERDEGLRAAALGIGDRFPQFIAGEIQAGKITGIGFVAKTAIDGIGTGIDGLVKGCRRACGANQFHAAASPAGLF